MISMVHGSWVYGKVGVVGVSYSGSVLDGLLRDRVDRSVCNELGRVLGELPELLERPSYNF